MKLHGLLVVQDEADVIEDLLSFLKQLKIYDTILFLDLGSKDDTFERALKFEDILYQPQKLTEIYTEKLRFDLLARHQNLYQEGDWLAIIDADEFYAENPLDLIRFAEQEGASYIQTYQVNFSFTDKDLENIGNEDSSLPIHERRKFYLINYSEERFFKFLPGPELFSRSRPCSRRLLNRHYQFRTPEQIQKRIRTRLENKRKARHLRGRHEWPQIFSENWKDYIVPHRTLHYLEDGNFHFGLPQSARWKDYYSKDPFSSVLPQVACVLANEQNGCRSDSDELYEKGRITFRNKYSEKVKSQMKKDLEKRNWLYALAACVVLIRYHVRELLKKIRLKRVIAETKGEVWLWNLTRTLSFLLRRKSTGSITAKPNPIEVSDNSGVGITLLTWTSRGAEKLEVHVDRPDGQIFHQTGSSGSKSTENWVSDNMVFFLQDVSGNKPLTNANTLAKVIVRVIKGKRITI